MWETVEHWPRLKPPRVGGEADLPLQPSNPQTLRWPLSRLPCLTPWAVRFVARVSRLHVIAVRNGTVDAHADCIMDSSRK